MMPISNKWYDSEKRILDQHFEGDWRWEEVNGAAEEAHAMAASVQHEIVMICDMSQTTSLPKGNVLSPARSNLSQVPENITQIIFVIQSRLIEVFASLVFEMMPRWKQRARIVKSREEAEQIVRTFISNQNKESRS